MAPRRGARVITSSACPSSRGAGRGHEQLERGVALPGPAPAAPVKLRPGGVGHDQVEGVVDHRLGPPRSGTPRPPLRIERPRRCGRTRSPWWCHRPPRPRRCPLAKLSAFPPLGRRAAPRYGCGCRCRRAAPACPLRRSPSHRRRGHGRVPRPCPRVMPISPANTRSPPVAMVPLRMTRSIVAHALRAAIYNVLLPVAGQALL